MILPFRKFIYHFFLCFVNLCKLGYFIILYALTINMYNVIFYRLEKAKTMKQPNQIIK